MPALICQPVPGFELVRFREVQDAVVAFVPAFQAAPDFVLGRAWLQAHERVREIVAFEIVLRREIVGFGFSVLAHELCSFIVLVHVVGNGPEIIEELAKHASSRHRAA